MTPLTHVLVKRTEEHYRIMPFRHVTHGMVVAQIAVREELRHQIDMEEATAERE